MALKIKPEDYQALKTAIEKVLETLGGFKKVSEDYRKAGYSDKRFRWDCLWATRLRIGDGKGAPGDLNLYAYMNDDHIDSALKHIVKQLEGGKP